MRNILKNRFSASALLQTTRSKSKLISIKL
jgi:hypothetical protein